MFQAEEAKKLGNDCAKAEKYVEAVLHYSKAIKLAPQNATLYSNRSLMFLKMQQYYHGAEDARTAIKLMPKWQKVMHPSDISAIHSVLMFTLFKFTFLYISGILQAC